MIWCPFGPTGCDLSGTFEIHHSYRCFLFLCFLFNVTFIVIIIIIINNNNISLAQFVELLYPTTTQKNSSICYKIYIKK